MTEPQIWHYELVAQYWAENETESGPEGTFYKELIEHYGHPALDIGCGSGRLLLPFLEVGIDIDGCDISEDMISVYHERVEKQGYNPILYAQPMHALDLSRKYQTIIATGTIGLGGEHRLTQQRFQRCYEHLQPGGLFAFDYLARWNDPSAWSARLPKNRGLWVGGDLGIAPRWLMGLTSCWILECLAPTHWRIP